MPTRNAAGARVRKKKINPKSFVTADIAQIELPWAKDTAYKGVFKDPGGNDAGFPLDNVYLKKSWVGEADTVWVIVLKTPMFDTQEELDEYAS
jgi:hypothetical protein